MRRLLLVVCAAVLLVSAACRSKPPAVPPPPQFEENMLIEASQWEVLAGDIAGRMDARLADEGSKGFVHMTVVEPASPFARVFADMLLAKLTQRGFLGTTEESDYINVVEVGSRVLDHTRTPEEASDDPRPGEFDREVVVSVKARKGKAYLFGHTQVYNIADPEWWHYDAEPYFPGERQVKIKGWKDKAVTYGVTGDDPEIPGEDS